jgi:tetratricopeptide (TPR) repeat protein
MSTRLLRNGYGYGYEGRVHEDVTKSILQRGGPMQDTTKVSLVHYGYTAKETARKDRRGRNIELLEAAHRAHPEEPRYWHYLGIELHSCGDLQTAAGWFDRVLAKAPDYELASWSASGLAAIHEAEDDIGAAWAVAQGGIRGNAGRINCLVEVGALALREGDADTARWCADELDRNPTDDFTSRASGLERAIELRGGALVEKAGSGVSKESTKARDFLLSAVKRYPYSIALAGLFVRASEAALGRGRGVTDAMKRAGQATVVAASMNAAYANGAYAACAELGEKTNVVSEMWTFALAKRGRVEEARPHLVAFGERAALHAIVFGLAYDDEAAFAHAESMLSPLEVEALRLVRAGTRVPARFTCFVRGWLRLAVALREDGAATMLTRCLPWSLGEREAFRALATFHSGDPTGALPRALEHPAELASMEVIGLVAYQHGDFAGAAMMLGMRAKAGDASVRVHLKGADALVRLGRRQEAVRLLALGSESRPHSRGLMAAQGSLGVKRAA